MKKAVPFFLAFILLFLCGCGAKKAAEPNFTKKTNCTVTFEYKAASYTVALRYFHQSMEADVLSPPRMSRLGFRGDGGKITLKCDDISQSFDENEILENSPVRMIYSFLLAAENADYGNPSLLLSANDDGGGTYNIYCPTGGFLLTCNRDGMITRIEDEETDVIFTFESKNEK